VILLLLPLLPLPGSLTESYDELGNRYQLPAYALAPPVNLITETACDRDVAALAEDKAPPPPPKQEFQLRVRLSTGEKPPHIICVWIGGAPRLIPIIRIHLVEMYRLSVFKCNRLWSVCVCVCVCVCGW